MCGMAERGEVKAASLCRVLPVTNHCAARLQEKKNKTKEVSQEKVWRFFSGMNSLTATGSTGPDVGDGVFSTNWAMNRQYSVMPFVDMFVRLCRL